GGDVRAPGDAPGSPVAHAAGPAMLLLPEGVDDARRALAEPAEHGAPVHAQVRTRPRHEAGRRVLAGLGGDRAILERPLAPAAVHDPRGVRGAPPAHHT